MKQLLKISNSDIGYRLSLNYNNVYSRLKMLLGKKASLFADISTKSSGTTWYADDDAEYSRLSEAPKEDVNTLSVALNDVVSGVRKDLSAAPELANYVDDIIEIPDNSFVFYRKEGDGYKFILAGWGCKYAHQSTNDPSSGFIKRIPKMLEVPESSDSSVVTPHKDIKQIFEEFKDKLPEEQKNPENKQQNIPTEPQSGEKEPEVKQEEKKEAEPLVKKTQHIVVRVIDQNNNPVDGEVTQINTSNGEITKVTSEKGLVDVGNLPYGESFGVSFPDVSGNHERIFEVEPGVETYDTFIKKLIKYSPVLFIEDQNGNAVQDYNVKVVIKGQDTIYNSGMDGVIQLPMMQEGQKFVVIDTANYANTEEYNITQAEAKTPYHFHIKTAEKTKVGITVLDKSGKPIPKASVNLQIGDTPCQQQTVEDGRAEFPYNVFIEGDIPVNLNVKGKGRIKSNLRFTPDITEYTIQLQDKRGGAGMFNWKWLALLPILLLLGWAGYKGYEWLASSKVPSVDEMEKGVVLIQTLTSYTVDCSVDGITWLEDGKPLKFYFTYDDNTKEILEFTNVEAKRPWIRGTGTGFLISEDGLIATNRHIANPVTPKGAALAFKKRLADNQLEAQLDLDKLNDWIRDASVIRLVQNVPSFGDSIRKQKQLEDYIRTTERILKLGEFKVEVENHCSVAFVNSIIDSWDDFIGCSLRTEDDVADNYEKDVAILQLKNKKRDVPEGAYIFKVPDEDIMDGDVPDDYEITVLGYNLGVELADIKNGIHPQAQTGKIISKNDKFNIGYSANVFPGSSGSPVYNKKGQLVAVNNSGFAQKAFAYGIRTKYLKELLDKVQKKNKK